MKKVAFGGGCHWCTEAVFASLYGVKRVLQGYVKAKELEARSWSEAVIVAYDLKEIALADLIEIHLHTHSSTSNHSMRSKYRSAIYVMNEHDYSACQEILQMLQKDFEKTIVTKVLHFDAFRASDAIYHDYYLKHKNAPFCKKYIQPKLNLLYSEYNSFLKKGVVS